MIIDAEEGYVGITANVQAVKSWSDVRDVLALLQKGDHGFAFVVLDTLSSLYTLCAQDFCKRNSIVSEMDLEYGKGTGNVRSTFRNTLHAFFNLGIGVVMVAHEKQVEEKTRIGTFNKACASLPDQVRGDVEGLCDIILYATAEKGKDGKETVVLKSAGTHEYVAGDRFGLLPASIPFAKDANLFEVMAAPFKALQETK